MSKLYYLNGCFGFQDDKTLVCKLIYLCIFYFVRFKDMYAIEE